MPITDPLRPEDLALAAPLRDFVPAEVYDIHAHPHHPGHFAPGTWDVMFAGLPPQGPAEHRASLARYFPARTVHGLYFGLPHRSADRPAVNAWVAAETAAHGTPLSRSLLLVSPADDPGQVAAALRSGRHIGLKVYHCYAPRADTMQAAIEEFAPDWMWEILHEVRGVMLLHLVRDEAIADPVNQASLRRLMRAYPQARLILAHVARSFNYRHARAGLRAVADLDNVVVDTSAVCEAEAFRAALDILGPRRVLWGSDYGVSELRGRCVTTGGNFLWLHPETLRADHAAPTRTGFTLVGLESLLGLREACTDAGLTAGDVEDIFRRNALRLLAPHLPAAALPPAADADGSARWARARAVISGGTGLLSKRAEQFDPRGWPAYFSRCEGCQVWDLAGRRYVDFAGGVGAIALGYNDPEVTAAVRRRLSLGTYCTLVNPDEVALAERLIALHPWAGKVRYARGGGEALTIAVRVARAATGRSPVLFCGYHGWHDWYLAANLGATDALDGHLLPGLEPRGVPRELRGTAVPFRYNDPASFEAALAGLKDAPAAVVMEPMRAQFPREDFVARVAARCRAAGAVFILDEVTSGLRCGLPGAHTRLGVTPDLVVYAKAMSNGFPFGVVVGRDDLMQAADASFISSSYWTDAVGPAAALAVLEKAARLDLAGEIWAKGEAFQASWRGLTARHPAARVVVGGIPAVPTISFDHGPLAGAAKARYVRGMAARGFLAATYHYLMHAHGPAEIAAFFTAADEVLADLAAAAAAGDLARESGGAAAQTGFARLA